MRDHDVVYGSGKAGLDKALMRSVSAHIQGFIDANPTLVHAEADTSWLLGTAGQGEAPDGAELGDVEEAEEHLLEPDGRAAAPDGAANHLQGGDMTEASSPAEALARWLASPHKSSVAPGFEIGSLAFLRSQGHQALLEHLDKAGNLDYGGAGEVSTPTISASIFLPQKSVIRFRKRERRSPSPPDSTPEPTLLSQAQAARGGSSSIVAVWPVEGTQQPGAGDIGEAMAARFAFWELVVEDFGKQGGMPGLRSGNTVIDERNFALGQWR